MKGQFSDNIIKVWTKFGFGNVQSLKRKENLLRDCLVEEKTGLFLAMETWLKNDIESQIQIQGSALNTESYKISVANRETGSRGGRLALIYRDTLDCKLLEKGHVHTFEHAYWEISGHNMTLALLALYHPPPSPKQKHTISEFVTEFVEFLADNLNKYTGDLIIAGDFNIHVNDLFNEDAQQLFSVMEALGIDQLVDFCTHKSGNILDLLFTCMGNKIKCVNIKLDGFISEHCLIQAQLTLVQNLCCMTQKPSQEFNNLNFRKFWSDANLEELSEPLKDYENANLEEFLTVCTERITSSLNKHAPLRILNRKLRPRRSWYNKEVQAQRCIVQKRERLWRIYLHDHLWIAFKIERNRYM